MRVQSTQSNSLIDSTIGKSEKTQSQALKTTKTHGFSRFSQLVRGAACLAVLTGLAVLQRGNEPTVSSGFVAESNITSATIQKADIIDDLIDIINDILNPPGSGSDPTKP